MAAMEEQNYLWKEKQETEESIPYSQDRLVQKLNIRKKAINQKLFSTRVIPSSNEFQSQRIEEDKEELLDTGVKTIHYTSTTTTIGEKSMVRDAGCAKPGATPRKTVPGSDVFTVAKEATPKRNALSVTYIRHSRYSNNWDHNHTNQ